MRTPRTPAERDMSPMHSVKPVPRNSHNAISTNYDNHGTTTAAPPAATLLRLHPTDSELSIATEGYTVDDAIVARSYDDNAVDSRHCGGEDGAETPSSASWVGRKVDAIFSPVLSFLHGATATTAGGGQNDGGVDGVHGERRGHDGEEGEEAVDTTSTLQKTYSSEGEENDDDSDKAIAVSNAIRNALREAASDLQEEQSLVEEGQHHHKQQQQRKNTAALHRHTDSNNTGIDNQNSGSFDVIPSMTNTDSSTLDADGDVAMVDNHYENGGTMYGQETEEEIYVSHNNDNSHHAHEQRIATQYETAPPEDEEEDEDEFNPYLFIKSLPPYHYAIPPGWTSRPKTLPPINNSSSSAVPPICLVLDLDETLVHCTVEPVSDADMIFPVEFNGMEYTVHVRCRPFLTEFLEKVSEDFEVVVFTASQQVYADKLLDMIDPGK